MRLRDYARHGGRNFLAKVLRGENPFSPDHEEQRVLSRDEIIALTDGPHVLSRDPVSGLPTMFDISLSAKSKDKAFEFVMMVAKQIAETPLDDGHQWKLAGLYGEEGKSVGEFRALVAMTDKAAQQNLVARWIDENKAAYKPPSNSGVAVPHLAF